MSFKEAVTSCLSNYVGFEGRARRSEYWFFYLFNLAVAFAAYLLSQLLKTNAISTIVTLALLLPGLSVSVRRLHDVGKKGWYLLMVFVPVVGAILVLVKLCTEGDAGPNVFGPDPKNRAGYTQASYTSAYANPHEEPGSAQRYGTQPVYEDEITRAVSGQNAKYCTYCGSKLGPGQKFCTNCGAMIE